MHPIPPECMQLGMMCLLFPAHDVTLYADRTTPSPWPLSVKLLPLKNFRIGGLYFTIGNKKWKIKI